MSEESGIECSGVNAMKAICVVAIAGMFASGVVRAQKPPLLPEKDVAAMANELSGETAKRNLEAIAQFHRQRGSKGFHEAAELVAERLREYGLSDVAILEFPADGKIFYGTQRSRPAWDAEFAELRLVWSEAFDGCVGDDACAWTHFESAQSEYFLESYETEPLVLAEDSESADVRAELVDVGEGTQESDYSGKEVKGKIVLVSAQPGAVQDLAVGKFGAAGIVSYAQNQKTAWSGENLDAIRWGHLGTFSGNKTFAFMMSLRAAHGFQERLKKGEAIRLHAVVKAGQHAGNYEVVTATIPGADAKLKNEEIVFSCHLDHQRPGANDNASGCATILEVARTLQKLIDEGKLTRPSRTIRLIFPPEIEGTLALLNGHGQFATWSSSEEVGKTSIPISDHLLLGPELAKRIKAVVHMDMVGGGPETKAVFHVTRGPMSLPSFVQDVAWSFAEWVNEQSYNFAAGLKAQYPMVEKEGGKEPLRAEYSAYTMGSDHDVYQDSSFRIPAIYLNDWPDRFIHTNLDVPANIDATKLKRAGFIGAASGYFLAGSTNEEAAAAHRHLSVSMLAEGRFARTAAQTHRCQSLSEYDCTRTAIAFQNYENAVLKSYQEYPAISNLAGHSEDQQIEALGRALYGYLGGLGMSGTVESLLKFRRNMEPKGPMAVFGYDYFAAEWGKRGHTARPKLLEYEGLWGGGEEYAYEVLNFADGRNAQEIRDAVSAEYGPVGLGLVVEYLKALEEIGVVEEVK
jgi:aminopeptidase YwaD